MKIYHHSFHTLATRWLSFTSLRALMDIVLGLSCQICQSHKLDLTNPSADCFHYHSRGRSDPWLGLACKTTESVQTLSKEMAFMCDICGV